MTREEYEEKISKWYVSRRHIVIIGAGASIASLPDGDYYGHKPSCMNDIIEDLGLKDILEKVNLKTKSHNIEDIYSELYERDDCATVREQVEQAIFDYYSKIRIPDKLTIYDLLVLSLRKKDVIVSFNWDSLLLQAYLRWEKEIKDLPQLLFLHGNVGLGVCDACHAPFPIGEFLPNDDKFYSNNCPNCHAQLRPLKLLYPVKHKDYNKDPFINAQWDYLQNIICNGAITTVFGYKAPASDVEAMEIIKKAFVKLGEESRQFDILEIIERPGFSLEELTESWWEIVDFTKHTPKLYHSFFESTLARFPRRTIEAAKIYNLDGHFAIPICQFKEEDLEKGAYELVHNKMGELLKKEMQNDYSVESK